MSTEEARQRLEQAWRLDGDCPTCGWHSSIEEHDISDVDIEHALAGDGYLHLRCLKEPENDLHRGIRIYVRKE